VQSNVTRPYRHDTVPRPAIRIAIVDSGVHATHPHVQGVAGGVGIDLEGREHADFIDRLGHGTAVAAAIREKAPDAALYAVKVFDRALSTSGLALAAACGWAIDRHMDLINLSLGTVVREHESTLATVVARARQNRAMVIAAGEHDGSRWLPGSLPGVCAVTLDWSLPRHECRASTGADGGISLRACGYPRPIPGVPPERNLSGLSFAVANATGIVAALLAQEGEGGDPYDVVRSAIGRGWTGSLSSWKGPNVPLL
jgi:subtilisin family serine protease